MKSLLIAAGCFCLLVAPCFAGTEDYGARIQVSHSEQSFLTPTMISSAPFEAFAVRIDSPAPNGWIVFYRSTSPVFDADLATQTKVNCGYFIDISTSGTQTSNLKSFTGPPVTVPLFDVLNDSYTFYQVTAPCARTLYFKWPDPILATEGRTKGFGLPQTGRIRAPDNYP